MRIVVQRVSRAQVSIEGKVHSSIGKGYLILLGIGSDDTEEDITWLAQKVVKLRIFDDANGVMNLSIQDVGGD
ncbi:MAG: D-aminoacyl-tRNA deacylase, partial [Prevotella sp.]